MGVINVPVKQEVPLPESTFKGIITTDEAVVISTPAVQEEDTEDLMGLKLFFGLDVEYEGENDSLRYILNWAKEKGIDNRADLSNEVRKLESKIGIGLLNGSRAKQIKDYLILASQFTDAKKKLEYFNGKI